MWYSMSHIASKGDLCLNSLVSVAPCAGYDDAEVEGALRALLEPLGGLDFVTPGMRVVVKVNLVTAMKPDSAATVHPAVVCALVRLLRERGAARVVVGDSPGGVYSAPYLRVVYDVCGMRSVEQAGGTLNNDFSQIEAEYPEAVQAKRFPFTAFLRDADAIIDLCKLKTHGMMGLSCAVKNMFGIIPGQSSRNSTTAIRRRRILRTCWWISTSIQSPACASATRSSAWRATVRRRARRGVSAV